MLEPFHAFVETLNERGYKGLEVVTEILAGKDHLTVARPGLKKALTALNLES